MPESGTSCKCVAVQVPVVKDAKVWTPNDVKVDSETAVVLNVGQSVIFREWSVQEKFAWSFNSATQLECLEVVGEPYEGIYFQQIQVRAATPNCKFALKFEKIDKSASLTFNFSVWPKAEPEVQGEMYNLDKAVWTVQQSVTIEAKNFLTVRLE